MLLILHLLISGLFSDRLPVLLSKWLVTINLCHLSQRRWKKMDKCLTVSQPCWPTKLRNCQESARLSPIHAASPCLIGKCIGRTLHMLWWSCEAEIGSYATGAIILLLLGDCVRTVAFQSDNDLICKAGWLICLASPRKFLQAQEWGTQTTRISNAWHGW